MGQDSQTQCIAFVHSECKMSKVVEFRKVSLLATRHDCTPVVHRPPKSLKKILARTPGGDAMYVARVYDVTRMVLCLCETHSGYHLIFSSTRHHTSPSFLQFAILEPKSCTPKLVT